MRASVSVPVGAVKLVAVPSIADFFRQLIENPRETRTRDNKGKMSWPEAKTAARYELLRDIMAFSNTMDGGTMIFGIQDATHELLGLDEEEVKSFDKSSIYEALSAYASPVPQFEVERCPIDGISYVAIVVREFEEVPTVCKKEARATKGEARPNEKPLLRKAAVYIRTEGAQTIEIDREELMRDLLNLATRRKGDHLLRQILDLIPMAFRQPSPPPVSPYQEEIAAAKKDLAGG